MILLDTNYLIRTLVKGTAEARRVIEWLSAGEDLCASSIAWYEFLCGPIDEEGIDTVRSIIDDRVIAYTADQAIESSRLFNATGRKKRLRVDAMIAAAAIVANARLATDNMEDFSAFCPFGLKLDDPSSPSTDLKLPDAGENVPRELTRNGCHAGVPIH